MIVPRYFAGSDGIEYRVLGATMRAGEMIVADPLVEQVDPR